LRTNHRRRNYWKIEKAVAEEEAEQQEVLHAPGCLQVVAGEELDLQALGAELSLMLDCLLA
jgi:hypothetical protein